MEIKRITIDESYLVTDLFDKYRVFYKQVSDPTLAQNFINTRLRNNESVIFVATVTDGDQVIPVGFTQLYPKFSSARAIKIWVLNDLYVEPTYRKQGIGEGLIKTALRYAKDDMASYVELSTAVDNHTAQGLYEAIGFERHELSAGFFDYIIRVD